MSDMEIIYSYTRADAIADGSLIPVSEKTLKEAGIKIPTVITQAVWFECIEVDEKDAKNGQDKEGRLWDVLYMFTIGARNNKNSSQFIYEVIVNKHRKNKYYKIKALIHGGDNGEPVLTLMFPEED